MVLFHCFMQQRLVKVPESVLRVSRPIKTCNVSDFKQKVALYSQIAFVVYGVTQNYSESFAFHAKKKRAVFYAPSRALLTVIKTCFEANRAKHTLMKPVFQSNISFLIAFKRIRIHKTYVEPIISL